MRMTAPLAILTATLCALAACQVSPTPSPTASGPSAEEMRSALKQMLDNHPDLAIPEFTDSLKYDHPINHNGVIVIGNWSCDPRMHSFEAVLTAPNITFYDLTGRFQQDVQGNWRAFPHEPTIVTTHDIGEFWRASEVDASHD